MPAQIAERLYKFLYVNRKVLGPHSSNLSSSMYATRLPGPQANGQHFASCGSGLTSRYLPLSDSA